MERIKVGEGVRNFNFDTPWKENLDLKSEIAGKKTFLVFLRYYGCTICQLDIRNLIMRYNEFRGKDAKVYIVLQSDPKLIKESIEEKDMPFDIICDPNQRFYNQYKINPAKSKFGMISINAIKKVIKGQKMGIKHGKYEGNELQLPAVFFIDEEGIYRYVHYGKDVADIPTIDEMLTLI